MDEPTEWFDNAFLGGGGIRATCGFCNRHHFEDDPIAGTWDEGELEQLQAEEQREPDKTIGSDGTVRVGQIAGITYVQGCPCNKARIYEDFIWGHRHQIARYLKDRATDDLEAAKFSHALAFGIPDNMR